MGVNYHPVDAEKGDPILILIKIQGFTWRINHKQASLSEDIMQSGKTIKQPSYKYRVFNLKVDR